MRGGALEDKMFALEDSTPKTVNFFRKKKPKITPNARLQDCTITLICESIYSEHQKYTQKYFAKNRRFLGSMRGDIIIYIVYIIFFRRDIPSTHFLM